MTLAARILVARAQAANRKAARRRRAELVRELAGYAADHGDFEATLARYPPEVTRELRSILARHYMAAGETRFPAIGRG
jgi:hypothetical protein